MSIQIYFPVILQSASQFLLYDTGAPIAGTFGLPLNTRIYSYHPAAANDALTLLNAALTGKFTAAMENDRQISIAPDDPDYDLRLAATTDGLKLARLLGMYEDGPPLDLAYYQTHDLSTLDPCGVTLQSAFPGMIGYLHESYDLLGTPDHPGVHGVSDAGYAAQIAGARRSMLDLSLKNLAGSLFSSAEDGSFTSTWSATIWQAYDPRYSAPYVLICEDGECWEYAIREPLTASSARPKRADWHAHFDLDLKLQLIGHWEAPA